MHDDTYIVNTYIVTAFRNYLFYAFQACANIHMLPRTASQPPDFVLFRLTPYSRRILPRAFSPRVSYLAANSFSFMGGMR